MTSGTSGKNLTSNTPQGLNLRIEFQGTDEPLSLDKKNHLADKMVLPVPSNDQQTPSLVPRVLEVGQRLRDGTVVLSVDLDKDEALFLPAQIFGGTSKSDYQDGIVHSVNNVALHGHQDWRRITDAEGETLRRNWAKVTTQAPECFWLASPNSDSEGRVHARGIPLWLTGYGRSTAAVPVVRSGPAQNFDI